MYSENQTSQLCRIWMTASEETKTVTQLSSNYAQGRQGTELEKKFMKTRDKIC